MYTLHPKKICINCKFLVILRFDNLQNVAISKTVAGALQWVEKLRECAVCYNIWLLEHWQECCKRWNSGTTIDRTVVSRKVAEMGVLQKVEQWQRGESA